MRTEVCSNTDVLNQPCRHGHGWHIGQNGREVEGATRDGGSALVRDCLCENSSVRRFIVPDRRELFDRDLCIREACRSEIGGLEFGERLGIKLRLKLLQNICKLCRNEQPSDE